MNTSGHLSKKSSTKKSNKINVNKLIDSEKPFSEYTHEEEKALKMKLFKLGPGLCPPFLRHFLFAIITDHNYLQYKNAKRNCPTFGRVKDPLS